MAGRITTAPCGPGGTLHRRASVPAPGPAARCTAAGHATMHRDGELSLVHVETHGPEGNCARCRTSVIMVSPLRWGEGGGTRRGGNNPALGPGRSVVRPPGVLRSFHSREEAPDLLGLLARILVEEFAHMLDCELEHVRASHRLVDPVRVARQVALRDPPLVSDVERRMLVRDVVEVLRPGFLGCIEECLPVAGSALEGADQGTRSERPELLGTRHRIAHRQLGGESLVAIGIGSVGHAALFSG